MSATDQGAANDYEADFEGTDEFGAADEFLKGMIPADAERPSGSEEDDDNENVTAKPAKKSKTPAPKEEPEDEDDEDGEGDEEKDDENEGDEDDDEDGEKGEKDKGEEEPKTIRKIKVGDEVHEVPIEQLDRLYGQEASLTKKSMEVAELRKTAESDIERTTASAAVLLERARLRAKPYQGIDFNLAAQKLTEEEYVALRKEATAANEEVQFLEQHTSAFMQKIKEQQATELRAKAVESIKVLSGPADKGGIEGFNDKLYNEIVEYAVSQGAPVEMVKQIVDPWAVRMMHSALMFEKGKSKSNVKIIKVNKTPKKVIKTTNSPAVTRSDGKPDQAKAMARLRRTGSSEDAEAAFLASFGVSDSDD